MAAARSPLISVAELAAIIDDPALVLLDVRWTLGQTDGRERYLEAHIPGARFVDLDRELADAASPARGRHPLPSREAFQRTLRGLGVTADSSIVVYDQAQSLSAARLWWLLRSAGFTSAAFGGPRIGGPGFGPGPGASFEVNRGGHNVHRITGWING